MSKTTKAKFTEIWVINVSLSNWDMDAQELIWLAKDLRTPILKILTAQLTWQGSVSSWLSLVEAGSSKQGTSFNHFIINYQGLLNSFLIMQKIKNKKNKELR